jgi:hypothetical protein
MFNEDFYLPLYLPLWHTVQYMHVYLRATTIKSFFFTIFSVIQLLHPNIHASHGPEGAVPLFLNCLPLSDRL